MTNTRLVRGTELRFGQTDDARPPPGLLDPDMLTDRGLHAAAVLTELAGTGAQFLVQLRATVRVTTVTCADGITDTADPPATSDAPSSTACTRPPGPHHRAQGQITAPAVQERPLPARPQHPDHQHHCHHQRPEPKHTTRESKSLTTALGP